MQVNGLREMFGSHTKPFRPGRAAQSGLMAAVLASNGYTSSLQGLEAKRGWDSVVSAENNLDAHIQSLGTVWEITKNAYKPFLCSIVVHPITLIAASNFTKNSTQRGKKYFELQERTPPGAPTRL